MQITKPIIFFDLETTGTDVNNDRIVQIATIKIDIDGSKEEKCILINPTIAIPEQASEVHKITNEMVFDQPTFKQISKSLFDYFKDCDLGGFNSDYFDVPLLIKEFARCGIIFPQWEISLVDVLKYEKLLRPNKLTDVYKRYTGKDLEDAHDALNDVRATLEVLLHQTDGNEEITPADIDVACQGERKRFDLSGKLYLNKDNIVCWSIGKNAHKPVTEDMNYFNWALKSDFPEDTKDKLRSLLK